MAVTAKGTRSSDATTRAKATGEVATEKLTGSLRRGSVKKNVAAIHVSGKLTLLQRKLSNVLLLNAYDALDSKPTHRIDARALCLMIGYNSNDMDTLKASLRGLAETVAEWDMLGEDGEHEWGVSALLAYAKLKGGVCEYAYSPALAAKLHDPKVFALINLNIQRRFTSGHALALYENCYRFVRTGSTGWWDLGLFRRLMGVDGSTYYEVYKHLNAKVIKPAVAEVNKTSNIELIPEVRKQGRSITDIRFKIRENKQLAMFDIDDDEGLRDTGTYDRLRALGVSDRLARQWISEHGEDYVAEKLAYMAGQAGVKSPLRYISAAITRGYGDASDSAPAAAGGAPSEEAAAPTPEMLAQRAAALEVEKAEAERSGQLSAERKHRAARMARVREVVAQRTPTQRDSDKKLFLTGLKDSLEREDFARLGWASALNARAIFAFWEELQPGVFDDLEG